MTRELWKGNNAIAEAAVRAGVQAYFGYPITPQTELLEYMSARMPALGRAFVQAESEVAAINMVYGAACTGSRVMSSSSSPGVSLMMEGISYIAATEVPAVLVDVMRGGPGLGNISPGQADYNQIIHGGGHGDYQLIVLAPASVQEAVDLTYEAFDIAEKYRSIVVVLLDGNIGQMMEPATMPEMRPLKKEFPEWAARGRGDGERRVLTSIYIDPPAEETANLRLLRRWEEVKKNEIRYKTYFMEDAEYAIIGYGSAGRSALTAVREARANGIKIGLVRPITLNPFPEALVEEICQQVKGLLVVELSAGQMLRDIERLVKARIPVEFYARVGGVVALPNEIYDAIERLVNVPQAADGRGFERWLELMP